MSFTNSRDVYLVAGSRAVSVFGDFLAATTLALVLQQAGHGGLAVSGLLVAAALPIALLAPLAGRAVDRIDSRMLIVVVAVLQAAVCGVLAYASNPVLIIALAGLLAAGLAFEQPTFSALVPEMVGPDELGRASGMVQTASQIGMLAGPALAGVLVGVAGAHLPLLLDGVTYLAVAGAGLLIRTRRRPGVVAAGAEPARNDGWGLRKDRSLLVMTVALGAVIAAVSLINVVDVFFVRGTLHASTTWYGIVTASWTVGQLIGTPLLARVRAQRIGVGLLLLVAAGASAAVAVIAAVPNAAWMIVPMVVGGVFNGGINVFCQIVLIDRVPAQHRGKAFATFGAAIQGGMLVGLIAGGPLVESFDARTLVLAAGLGGLLVTAVAYPAAKVRLEPPVAPAAGDLVCAGDSVEG